MQWSASSEGSAGVTVNVPTRTVLFDDIKARFAQGEGFCVATLNLDHVVKLRDSEDFLKAYLQHTHVTADGNPIVWLQRLAGQQVDLMTGSDLVVPLAGLAAENGRSIAFFGSSDDVLKGAEKHLTETFPDLRIVAKIAPPMGFDPTGPAADAYIEELSASGADMCLLALGAPKQELFAAYAHRKLSHMGFLSIGASLDFLAGTQRRAPKWVRRIAAEWLWRLLSNPRRLAARYASCIVILPRLFARALKSRFTGGLGAAQ